MRRPARPLFHLVSEDEDNNEDNKEDDKEDDNEENNEDDNEDHNKGLADLLVPSLKVMVIMKVSSPHKD